MEKTLWDYLEEHSALPEDFAAFAASVELVPNSAPADVKTFCKKAINSRSRVLSHKHLYRFPHLHLHFRFDRSFHPVESGRKKVTSSMLRFLLGFVKSQCRLQRIAIFLGCSVAYAYDGQTPKILDEKEPVNKAASRIRTGRSSRTIRQSESLSRMGNRQRYLMSGID